MINKTQINCTDNINPPQLKIPETLKLSIFILKPIIIKLFIYWSNSKMPGSFFHLFLPQHLSISPRPIMMRNYQKMLIGKIRIRNCAENKISNCTNLWATAPKLNCNLTSSFRGSTNNSSNPSLCSNDWSALATDSNVLRCCSVREELECWHFASSNNVDKESLWMWDASKFECFQLTRRLGMY